MYLKILLLSICFAGTICPSFAQQKDVIDILHADTYAVNMKSNIDSLLGNVRLKHKNMLMFCDKLYNHRDSNYVEAFGNVHVIQNDTLNLWGDFMLYNGNTEFAKVRDNVIMKDPKITLTTDFLDYDAANRVGYYFNKGTIKDSINTLISDMFMSQK